MSRELNSELFGEPAQPATRTSPRPSADRPTIATTEELRVVNFQVEAMGRKLKDFESKMEVMGGKWEEFTSLTKLKFERVQGHFQRQAEGIQSSFRDIHSKIATVASRINERKVSDAAITEMVERHQQLVQTFEVRLQQLQKVLADQELQLMHSRSELKDALRELEKLKRG